MQKIICIMIGLFFITSGFIGLSQNIQTNHEKKIFSLENNDFNNLNLQGNWISMPLYNNYAPNKMPDFDQRQDSWQKIDAGPNQQVDSTASGDDIVIGNTCIAPGNNAKLESSASGDDLVKWYYCGPTATANAIWYIDSRHEKNDYPDDNQDSCDLVTKYSGISDDHAAGNVPKLIEDLAANFLGTSGKCTTNVRDIVAGSWNFINNSKLIGQYKVILYDTNNITMDNLSNWMHFCGTIILRLDTPERGHFVTLQAVNNVTNQIIISDPDYDASNPADSHTQHNDANIVSHDTYSVNPGNLKVLNYPEDPCFITHAINIWKKPMISSIFIYPHTTVDMDGDGREMFHIINVEEPTDDCIIYYTLPNGIEYAGGAQINGVPTEPIIDGDILKWYLPSMYPGQMYEVQFQISATSPEVLELERRVRVWAYSTVISTELYDDDFGVLEINDDEPPSIESVYHQIIEDDLSIYAEVTDNMKVKQVKVIITDPLQQTNEYEMVKLTGDLYKITFDISNWITGEYMYYIWAMDLGGNEVASSVYDFQIPSETQLLADADGPYEGNIMEDIEFDSTVNGGVPPYEYLWDYGDGNTSSGDPHPTHNYGSAGNYTVILTVTDSEEDTASDTTWTYINAPPNSPIIDGPQQGKEELKYTYTAITTDPDGDQIFYIWNFSDSIELIETLIPLDSGEICKLNHTFAEKGDYTLRVKSRDIYDAESEWSDPLEISIPKTKIYNTFIQLFYKILGRFVFFGEILD